MSPFQSPTVRRRRLGHELRRLREQAGFTLEDVAGRLEWSGSKVSRIETAKVKVRPRDVTDLLDLYGVPDDQHRAKLLTLTREALQQGWWLQYDDALGTGADIWIGMEAETVAFRIFTVQLASGLLQTPDYARAVLRAMWTSETVDQVERRVQVRMMRQELLTQENPAQLWSVMDEGVLHRPIGGREVMRGQLRRLMELGELPNVTLQVLPFSAGAHAGLDGPFNILELPAPDPEVVFIEHPFSSVFIERHEEVRHYTRTFDRLRATAMSPDDSLNYIKRAEQDL